MVYSSVHPFIIIKNECGHNEHPIKLCIIISTVVAGILLYSSDSDYFSLYRDWREVFKPENNYNGGTYSRQ